MHLGANNPRISYSFNNSTIVCAESMRDLSVIVVLSLTPMLIMLFLKHMLVFLCYLEGFLHEILFYYAMQTQRMSVLYLSMLPLSGTNVWNPHLLKHVNALERVQLHFTKQITVWREVGLSRG